MQALRKNWLSGINFEFERKDSKFRRLIQKNIYLLHLYLYRETIEIRNLFKPYIKQDSDIFGNEDLNDLLAKNKDVEEKHFKLWITNTTVPQRILNNAIYGRSLHLRSIPNKK